jgi:hypothetical protein
MLYSSRSAIRRQLPTSYFKLKVSKLVADGRLKLTAVNAGVNAAA